MLSKAIITFISYAAGFLAAAYLIEGFDLTFTLPSFLALIAVFTLIHLIIRPLIKLVLSPLILITFGLFNLVITAALLYIVDIYSAHISITGLTPLIYSTVVITIISLMFQAFGHHQKAD